MRKNSKKGFTIVELVIVIAVIAILAAVMIPTFSGMVQKAKDTAAQQNAAVIYRQVLATKEDAAIAGTVYIKAEAGGQVYWYSVEDGEFTKLDKAPTVTVIEANNDLPQATTTAQTVYVNVGHDAVEDIYNLQGEEYALYVEYVVPAAPVTGD